MPTVTKLFSFDSDSEGWSGFGDLFFLGWDSTNQCLHASLDNTSGTSQETGYFQYEGTLESLGVPSGAIVTNIRLNSARELAEFADADSGGVVGPYTLYLVDSFQTILKDGYNFNLAGPPGDWVTVDPQPDQTVDYSSDTTIQLRIENTVDAFGNYSMFFDDVEFVITYTGGESTSNADATLIVDHPTIDTSATFVAPLYQGSLSFTVAHPTISASATFVIPTYHGTFSHTVTHPTIVANGSLVLVYTGNSALTTHHPTIISGSINTYSGSSALLKHPIIVTSASFNGMKQHLVTQGWGYGQRIIRRGYVTYSPAYVATATLSKHPIITTLASASNRGDLDIALSHPHLSASGVFYISSNRINYAFDITDKINISEIITNHASIILRIANNQIIEIFLNDGGPCQHNPKF